jgi:hypothetical protein
MAATRGFSLGVASEGSSFARVRLSLAHKLAADAIPMADFKNERRQTSKPTCVIERLRSVDDIHTIVD